LAVSYKKMEEMAEAMSNEDIIKLIVSASGFNIAHWTKGV